ncbi:methyltransferase family protein [Gordonia sp. (in: high G+C Gram-positive bacteria)]|uniref:methyltransferase family protein n=1 Tax=Gordonia sp. (in: high G+C Gram-positive bacteria) TaxID=84139 RepID=UPI003C75355E
MMSSIETGRDGSHSPISSEPTASGAHVTKIPPPLYFVVAFLVGIGLDAVAEWNKDSGGWYRWVGIALIVAGAAMVLAAVAAFRSHHTTIIPHRPVSQMVTTGVYRLSRNPMYTGIAIIYLGIVGVTPSWWPLVTLPFALLAVRFLVIRPEETYLSLRAPAEFEAYSSRVRRWL